MSVANTSLRYWAADDTEKCTQGALNRRKTYRDWLVRSGRAQRMQRALATFYGYSPFGDADSSAISPSGEQGEIADLIVNHFASIVRQALVLITGDKAAFKAVAGNSDYRSLAQAALADGLLEYYDRKLNVSDLEYEAAFRAILMSEGWMSVTWDAAAGEVYGVDPDTQQTVQEGDVRFRVFSPAEVAYDVKVRPGALPWILLEDTANRHDLAAQYPDKADDILATKREKDVLDWTQLAISQREGEEDTVPVFELYHAPSPAVPQGRLVIFLSATCCLFDGPLPYDEIPAYPMQPDTTIGLAAGHTGSFDLLGIQQGIDMTATIATTNLQAGGVANYWTPDASDLNVREVAGGMNLITSKVKPEVLDGVKIAPEVAAWAGIYVQWMQQLSGINPAVRGEVEKGMPAQGMAFLQAAAIQYHSRLQASFTRMRERVRTANIRLLQRYAKSKRVALIAGKANSYMRKEFSSEDLQDIDRVSVETIAPLMKTLQGRKTVADELLGRGMVKPTQYLTLLNTGRLEPIFEGEQANLLRIRHNKELLQDGIGLPTVQSIDPATGMAMFAEDGQPHVRPLQTDTHWLDIPEYLSVLAMPDARENPQVVKAVTDVVQYQLMLWRQMDPALIAILGGMPAPPPGLPMMPPGPPSQTPPPAEGATSSSIPTSAPPQMEGPAPRDVKLPRVPKSAGGEQPPIVGVTA